MTQKELFELAKKLVIYAGVKKKLSKTESQKILKDLLALQKKLEADTSSLGKQVQIFLKDIIWDIESGREINIDSIEQDEYIENYLHAENQVKAYNALLSRNLFTKAVESSGKDYTLAIKDIKKHFTASYKTLNEKNFAKYLLIINEFSLSKPQKYLKLLYKKSLLESDYPSAKILQALIETLNTFFSWLKKESLNILETWDIFSHFVLCDIRKNKLGFKTIDASRGNMKEEVYKKLLMKI